MPETKDISTSSGGTFTVPAFGSGRLSGSPRIVTPVENALAGMARLHNAMHGDDPAKRADVTALRAVYRRGAKNWRRRANVSRRQQGMRRVRLHLAMLATGSRPTTRYTGDDDLLPTAHPLAAATKGQRKALLIIEGRPDAPVAALPMAPEHVAILIGESKGDPLIALQVKSVWQPDKHPRDHRGRFMHLGAEVAATIDGKQQTGTVVDMRGQSVTVRTGDGSEHVVKAASAEVTGHAGPHMTLAEHARAHTQADRRYQQMAKAKHPEAAAWQQRRDELGATLEKRAAELSPDQLRRGLAGEHVDGPLAPAPEPTPEPEKSASALPGDGATRADGTEWGSGYSPSDPRTDPAYDRYVANLDANISHAMNEVGATDVLYDQIDGIDGAYQPERQAMHDALIAELMASYADMPREHKAVMLAGPSGAGKSTTIRKYGKHFGVEVDEQGRPTNFATVNPDDIKTMIVARGGLPPEYRDSYGLGDGEAAPLLHHESSHIAKRLRRQLLAHGTNILIDGTFSGSLDRKVSDVQRLRAEGYTVTGVLVDGDIERSLSNAGKRHTKGESLDTGQPLPGRYVSLGHIESQRPTGQWSDLMQRPHLSQNAENFEAARPVFNGGIVIFDSSTGDQKLVYKEEPQAGTTTVADGLGDKHLDLLRNGRAKRVSSGDLPGVIAHALRSAIGNDRSTYVEAGYRGYGHGFAPVGLRYIHVSPAGHVHDVARDPATGTVTRKPIPRADVEKIVEHYVKPDRTAAARAPQVRNPNPATLGAKPTRKPSQGTPGMLAGGKPPAEGIRPLRPRP